ncbi:hypothetical protein BpHYR1_044107 [Brachionus plicatilis]|uniref:Uncharacterized protein n=1 Tax=Brachionus plicatilis TaxID=10195 RepID=A0A3M7QA47_BRAPC|nr:hypothetical protein BpHYR1_044107 [Brachionus plicatilis]
MSNYPILFFVVQMKALLVRMGQLFGINNCAYACSEFFFAVVTLFGTGHSWAMSPVFSIKAVYDCSTSVDTPPILPKIG